MSGVVDALRVLEAVAGKQPIGVSALARELELPKASVHRALHTLGDAGWLSVVPGDQPRWRLTTKILKVSDNAGNEFGLRDVARPIMRELRDESTETIHLSVRDGAEMVLVERTDSQHVVRAFNPLGVHAPLHASASGKCVLALLPPDEIERILAIGLAKYTANTITDVGKLRADLEETRRTGYSVNHTEWRSDVAAVGAAIKTQLGTPFAAINITAPAARVSEADIPRFGKLVVAAASRIESQLKFASPG